jgi:Zn-dependent protease/predicted transcriptional regulator
MTVALALMKWSLRIGSLAGIGIFIHWSFLLVVAWVVFIFMARGEGAAGTAAGLLFVFALFGCVVLHELGHALAARRYRIPTRDITLLPIGGVARLERMPEEPSQEFWVAIAGPAVNVVIAVVLAVLIATMGEFRPFTEITWLGGGLEDFWLRLMWFNLILVFFNLLPAFPMDGGRVLRSVLARKLEFVRATRVAASVGQGMAIFFGFLGLLSFNPFLILIAFFVFLGAQVESNSVQMTAFIRGLVVADAMMIDFRELREDDDLAVAVKELLAGSQQEFPVVTDGEVVGLLDRRSLVEALAERGRSAKVSEVMRRDYPVVDENEPLDGIFHRMLQEGLSTLPVVREGIVIGLLTTENVGELVMINSAIKRRREARARQKNGRK